MKHVVITYFLYIYERSPRGTHYNNASFSSGPKHIGLGEAEAALKWHSSFPVLPKPIDYGYQFHDRNSWNEDNNLFQLVSIFFLALMILGPFC